MKRKKKAPRTLVSGINHEEVDFYSWDTVVRIDTAPVANTYHFVAASERLFVIPDRDRPVLTLPDGVKMFDINPAILVPAIPRIPPALVGAGKKLSDSLLIWRMSPAYESPEQWIQEVQQTGEIVCWLPQQSFVRLWVEAKMDQYVGIAFEIKSPHIKTPVAVLAAIFKPQYVYYPYSESSDPARLLTIDRYGSTMGQNKIRVADTVVYTDNSRRSFIHLSQNRI